jgi:hypothetical protein
MVISFADPTLRNQTRGVASYYDMLAEHAFGNFRDILENVALHPMMGVYLTHLRNLKEDPATGRVPDLNFAREITQLFAVGENKLNLDGTVVMGANGRPEVAYTGADLMGLAQVFTAGAGMPARRRRTAPRPASMARTPNLERDWRPMQAYNEYTANTSYHSVSEKKFWATTIPAQSKSDTEGDFKIAIDTVFNPPERRAVHRQAADPAPGHQQPQPGLRATRRHGVQRQRQRRPRRHEVGPEGHPAGRRGAYRQQRAVVRQGPRAGGPSGQPAARVRSQVDQQPLTGIGDTDNPATRLGQTPMSAPTVFNFFRPGYVPTSKAITDAGLVVPELQITHDISVAGYMNYIRTWTTLDANRDIKQTYAKEIALADKPVELVDRMNLLLFNGTMPETLKTQIVTAVTSRVLPVPTFTTTATTGGTLTKIADEGGTFTVTGTGTVRYGAGMTFVERSVSGAGTCTRASSAATRSSGR